MLNAEPTSYSAHAAGKALTGSGWNERKARKRELSAKCKAASKRTTVKPDLQIRHAAQSVAEAADGYLDKFIERVERILRRDGAGELVKKLNAVIPEQEPEEEVEPILLRQF